jgi:hypothetical protein
MLAMMMPPQMMDYDSPSRTKFVMKNDNRKGISSRFAACGLLFACIVRPTSARRCCNQLCSASTLFSINFVQHPTLFSINFVQHQLCSASTLFSIIDDWTSIRNLVIVRDKVPPAV